MLSANGWTSRRRDDLFPDFVFGGWWHIGLHDFDSVAMRLIAMLLLSYPQAGIWISNPEMHASRRSFLPYTPSIQGTSMLVLSAGGTT